MSIVLTIISTFQEKAMAPHSSTLAWKISWTEEPGRLQSMGSRRVGHNWATSLSLFTFMHWRRNSCLENPRDRGAWWAAIYGVTQSRTWLKPLSSSSSSITFQYLLKTLVLGKIESRRRRGWQRMDVWVASPTRWTWVWASSGSWWWTGKPGMLQSMGSQRVRHDWVTELN